MRYVVADVEADGFLEELTTIHCLSIRDLETDTVVSCANQPGYRSIDEGLAILANAERIYMHNGIKYDYPALRKVYPWFTLRREQIRDTLVIAQMRFNNIAAIDYANARLGKIPAKHAGMHSLEAWGYRLSVFKGEYTDWCEEQGIEFPFAVWRVQMQDYCDQDTAATKRLVQYIQQHGVSPESVEIEHALAWDLAVQEDAGVPFDVSAAQALQGRLAARRQELDVQLRQEFGPLTWRDGKPKIAKKGNKNTGLPAGVEYQKIKYVEFNPGSRTHIEIKLKQMFGWEPAEDEGIDEKTLKGINQDIPAIKFLLEYLMIVKRLGQLAEGKEAWMSHAKLNKFTGLQHIHGRVKQNGTITHRAAHASPNLAQVPKVGKPFGHDCRSLFYVPEGWVMLGADASGLEARCLAHYMAKHDGGVYGKLLLEGDVHTANRIALGLPEGKEWRDVSKTWYYAFMYGAGDLKLGTIMRPSASKATRQALGKKYRKAFLENTPALAALIDAVQFKTERQGNKKVKIARSFVRLPDGRQAFLRSSHSALNTLLQGAGAIICKRWIVNVNARLHLEFGRPGWDALWVPLLWIHDEREWAVRPLFADRFKEIVLEEIRKLTDHYQWRVPLDGEAKLGRTWADVH